MMKKIFYPSVFLLAIVLFSSCKKNTGQSLVNVVDADGNNYTAIKIGNQVWMAQNLRVTRYADGTPMVNGKFNNIDAHGQDDTTKYYFSETNTTDSTVLILYGRYYTWAAIMNGASPGSTVQGPCPNGWHVPSESEWQTLLGSLGGASNAGGVMKSYMDWTYVNDGVTTTPNASGFDALGSGVRTPAGPMNFFQQRAYFWTSSIKDSLEPVDFIIYNASTVVQDTTATPDQGYSCRCVQN